MTATHEWAIALKLHCLVCGIQHVDRGLWSSRAHKSHLCGHCGAIWRPYEYPTCGVRTQEQVHEDTLPESMTDAEYDAWYEHSGVQDGVGCRTGPRVVRTSRGA